MPEIIEIMQDVEMGKVDVEVDMNNEICIADESNYLMRVMIEVCEKKKK